MYDFPSAVGTFFVEFAVRYHLADLAALGPPLVVLIAVPLAARRAPGAPRWPLAAALVLALLYLASPHIVSGSDLAPRLRPLLVFALLCYSGVVLSPRARRRVTVLALLSGLGGVALLVTSFRSLGIPSTTSPRAFPSCVAAAASIRDLRSPLTLDPG